MSTGIKVLVVDDESGILLLCQHLLASSPYEVVTSQDPTEALEILAKENITLLLADIRLPEMDGFELITRAKAIQPDLAVVVMTGYRTVETAIKALRSGVDGLIIKPFELGSELANIIDNALRDNQQKRLAVSLNSVQPILKLGRMALLETNLRGLEKTIAPALAEVTQSQHAGFYLLPGGQETFEMLDSLGGAPGADDPFWQMESAAGLLAEKQGGELVLRPAGEAEGDLLAERGWESVYLLSYPRRKDRYLFFAAREAGKPVFSRGDRVLLAAFARQVAVTFENLRVFGQLAGIAQRVERSGGILQQAERMSVIEQVVPTLAHDMNNPLQSIKNSLYLASRPENRGEKSAYYLGLAQKELYRLEGAMQRVLGLTQPVCQDTASVDLEAVIKKVLDILQARLREGGIQVVTSFSRPVPLFTGSRDGIEQALLNLIVNSVEAMSEAGEKKLWIEAASEDGQLVLSIEDSGPGIPEEARSSLFKPFFTTKPDGSGVGLLVSQRAVETQGGTLANTAPVKGNGARMEIRLPCGGKTSSD